ncbi:hairy-related 8a [Paramormyrops kingsleyae]|uniref:Hairy-related 8a n=1 Tax=Paramormyrops kingsleyae TaxID=1676925 RepID=A0A3B3R6D1_9TELE|nr:transcription cofactor HES-6-like [Paramormyrops kingsleyae]
MTASSISNVSERNFNAKEERKLRKPLIEKRRRERINCSLEQLKGIMVDAYNLDQSKLEKADVLEITVQHMEALQRTHGTGGSMSSLGFESRQRYSSGYIQCMHEVHNLLLSCPGMDQTLGARLLNHLLQSLPQISTEGAGGSTPLPASPSQPAHSLTAAPLRTSPSSPVSPVSSPQLSQYQEVSESASAADGQPSPPDSPSSAVHPALLRAGLPAFFPGTDPSMWRPW